MTRWLIVGCGYVGTALGQWVQQHEPTSSVLGVRRTAPATPLPFPCIAAASDDPAFARHLPAEPFDVVVYCAAAKSHDPAAYARTYVDGAQGLVRAIQTHQKQAARLLFTSSTAVYPVDDGRVVDETFPVATDAGGVFRAVTMARAEQVFLQSGWPAVVLRLGGIYGPGRTSFLARVQRREAALSAHPSYTNRIHRDDCVGALGHLAGLAHPEAIYNGVDDAPADRNEVIQWLSAELGVGMPPGPSGVAGAAAHGGAGATSAASNASAASTASNASAASTASNASAASTASNASAISATSATGKRVSNARLKTSGYRLLYPTYRAGYGALLGLPREAPARGAI